MVSVVKRHFWPLFGLMAVLLVASCAFPTGYHGGSRVLVKSGALARSLSAVAGSTDQISGISLTLTDADGAAVDTVAIDPALESDHAFELEAGLTYNLDVAVTILNASAVSRIWDYSTSFTVPESGSLDIDVDVAKVLLSDSVLFLTPGQNYTITGSIIGSDSPTQGLTWTNDITGHVSVDPSGQVTANSPGTGVVYATPTSGTGLNGACVVIVHIPFYNDTWGAGVTGGAAYTATQSAVPNVGAKSVVLSYDNGGNASGGGVPTQTWTFTATAQSTGTITFQYSFSGFHAYAGAYAGLQSFTQSSGSNSLQSYSSVSGPFGPLTGTASLNLTVGQTYGFIVTGANGDSTSILNGNVTITEY